MSNTIVAALMLIAVSATANADTATQAAAGYPCRVQMRGLPVWLASSVIQGGAAAWAKCLAEVRQ